MAGRHPEENASSEELARRVAWFHEYTDRLDAQPPELPLRCPCCGCKTLQSRGNFQICQVCLWEDDGQDEDDADIIRGGPNGVLSLTQAPNQLPPVRSLRRAVHRRRAATPA